MNARFWVWANGGQVRITLRPGQSLSWGRSWEHDEGWSSENTTWSHQGNRIERLHATDGTDCDGRMSTQTRSLCPMDKLSAWHAEKDREPYPTWERVASYQRDYSAERAGY